MEFVFLISTTKLRTFQKTQSFNEACRSAAGRHFGQCLHYVVSIIHNLVMLKMKAALHGY